MLTESTLTFVCRTAATNDVLAIPTELPTQRSSRGTTPVLVGAFACPCSFVRMATRRLCSEALWLANTRYGSFGSPLGLVLPQDGGELRLRRLTATSSEVTMPYPAWAARPDNALCLPTALALADEISTFAGFALWDPRHLYNRCGEEAVEGASPRAPLFRYRSI